MKERSRAVPRPVNAPMEDLMALNPALSRKEGERREGGELYTSSGLFRSFMLTSGLKGQQVWGSVETLCVKKETVPRSPPFTDGGSRMVSP